MFTPVHQLSYIFELINLILGFFIVCSIFINAECWGDYIMKIRVSELRRLIKEELADIYEDEGSTPTAVGARLDKVAAKGASGAAQASKIIDTGVVDTKAEINDVIMDMVNKIMEANPEAATPQKMIQALMLVLKNLRGDKGKGTEAAAAEAELEAI